MVTCSLAMAAIVGASLCVKPVRQESIHYACATPFVDVPPGWVCIGYSPEDSVSGICHDAVTGASVRFEHQPRSVAQERGEVSQSPRFSPLSVTEGIRDVLIEQRRRVFGDEYPDRIPGADRFLPGSGAKRLAVTLTSGAEWNLVSDVYSKAQEDRFRELTFADDRRYCAGKPRGRTGKPVSSAELDSIKLGAPMDAVVGRLGSPSLAVPAGESGVALHYDVHGVGDTVWQVLLTFAQDQRLQAKERQSTP